MSGHFELTAELREDKGKGASRRLRRLADQIPAIIYGGDKDPQPLTLIRKDLEKALENEAFFSQVLTITVGSDPQKAILKDLQRHPAKNRVMHADFLRVDDKTVVKVNVPIHFLNEEACVGVKMQGGMIQHQATDVEVQCLPGDIPEYIEVDMLEVETGQIIHLSDITLPEGVASVALALGEDHDLAIASVVAPKGGADGDEEEAQTDEEAAEESAEEEEGGEE
jgi:large subunit ribosomal protein L25